jgi:pyruvate,water dikinase
MNNPVVLFLDQVDRSDALRAGPKAANLGCLRQSGLPVPSGFVVLADVFLDLVDSAGLLPLMAEIDELAHQSTEASELADRVERVQAGILSARLPPATAWEIQRSFAALLDETGAVVVRSSAIAEDLPEGSGAGQQLTVLNVQTADQLDRAIRRCWASLFSWPAIRYRARLAHAARRPAIAVIVQAQIACQVAGTLFTADPLRGTDRIVVEGTWGLGEAIAQGEVVPDRYVIDRQTLALAQPPVIANKRCQRVPDVGGTRLAPVPIWRRHRPVLGESSLGALALLGLQIEEIQGAPQDVEWGLAGGRWWIFQARPITVLAPADEESAAAARWDWTSGFLDERLIEPVSPLGWSVLRDGLEEYAFREPLRMLGVDPTDLEPLTRLWKGHPYVNVAVFEALYKLFPDWLLPEDARRFFPGGDVARRRRAPRPRSLLDPKVWLGLGRALLADPLAMSPFHNDRAWARFEGRYVKAIETLGARARRLDGDPTVALSTVLALIREVEAQNRRLLRIHRWSLVLAEVLYSGLRRLAEALLGPERGVAYCVDVVRELGDHSVQLNAALHALGQVADEGEFARRLDGFLRAYGHRSFSLDLLRPTFADEPEQVRALVRELRRSRRDLPVLDPRLADGSIANGSGGLHPLPIGQEGRGHPGRFAALLLPLAMLARRYARLREDQRFTWQRGLAVERHLYRLVGRQLAERNRLAQPDDVFFLTVAEIAAEADGPPLDLAARVSLRVRRFAEDRAQFDHDPQTSYPPFLHGSEPLRSFEWIADRSQSEASLGGGQGGFPALRGEPVSPGIGRGRARVVLHPEDLARVEPGEILVVRGADPGWTVVFDRLAGLVAESGGQLSHAAVIARECRLPAIVAVSRATSLIQTGEEIVVDGTAGVIRRVATLTAG